MRIGAMVYILHSHPRALMAAADPDRLMPPSTGVSGNLVTWSPSLECALSLAMNPESPGT